MSVAHQACSLPGFFIHMPPKCPDNSLALRSEEQSMAGKVVGEEGDQDGGIQRSFDHSSLRSFDHAEGVNAGLG